VKKHTVPTGWRVERLGRVVTINPDQLTEDTPSDAEFEYVELSGVAGLNAEPVSQTLRFAEAPSRARRRARNGDILVSTVRPNLQGFTRVRSAPANLVVSTGFAVLRPNGHADGEFLYQHILGDAFVQHLLPALVGSNYPAVNSDTIASYQIRLPPPVEQAKIGAVLRSVDEAVERSQAVLAQTRTLRQPSSTPSSPAASPAGTRSSRPCVSAISTPSAARRALRGCHCRDLRGRSGPVGRSRFLARGGQSRVNDPPRAKKKGPALSRKSLSDKK
jgi:hypothetical protein